ncbi:MAG: HD domain-containing protein, partial [bacterium]|nr:HD domain-containing protein [bacterium]
MAEIHDPKETGAHVKRVAGYARVLFEGWARRRGMSQIDMERQRDRLSIAAMLHDVGKIGIPDSILKKPGRLEPEEFARMQMHTLIGARVFEHTHADFDELARIVALHHHERWDGAGYPGALDPDQVFQAPAEPIRHGLAGDDIPIEARIV